MTTGNAAKLVGLFALLLGAAGACNGMTETRGSETNWIDMCAVDSDCAVGSCICGVCTAKCTDASDCPSGSGLDTCASSTSLASGKLCTHANATPSAVCLRGCGGGTDCATGFVCESGACIPKAVTATATRPDAGSGGASGIDSGTATGGAGDSHTSMTSSEFVSSLMLDGSAGNIDGKCLPRQLPVTGGQASCVLLEVPPAQTDCDCDASGRHAATTVELAAAQERMRIAGECDVEGMPSCDSVCACELVQSTGEALHECQSDTTIGDSNPGWCYVDPAAGLGSTDIVKHCDDADRQVLRVTGEAPGHTYLIECSGTTQQTVPNDPMPGNLGDPCTPGDEYNPNFSGFDEAEVSIESGSPGCTTGICLVANFRGRTTCAYGQRASTNAVADPSLPADQRCYLPGETGNAAALVTVPVLSQLVSRPPERAVTCSCRCDGPAGTGPFCACPGGFECAPLVGVYGTDPRTRAFAGSYCIEAGTGVSDGSRLSNTQACDRDDPSAHCPPPAPEPDGG